MTDMTDARDGVEGDHDRPLDPSAYVVLGMIRLGARSGYEIKAKVESSIRYFWTISQAQIYPTLDRLERARLVRGQADPKGKRPRRVYELTDAGERVLEAWLRRDEAMSFELRDVGLLKLFFADALDRAGAAALVAAYRRRTEERIAVLRAIEPAARAAEREGNVHPLLTLQMGIAFHRALLDVCRTFEEMTFAPPAPRSRKARPATKGTTPRRGR